MRQEKFGQVIFREEEAADAAATTGEQTLNKPAAAAASPIRFSNLDGKWYTRDNGEQVHDDAYATNIGKTVSLRCSFSVEDQSGKVVSREMTFLLPDKLGELVEPNLELLVRNGNKLIMMEQALRAGYNIEEEIDRTAKTLEGGSFPAFVGVGKAGAENDDIMLHLSWELTFVLDDVLVSDDNDESKQEFRRYCHLDKIIRHFVDVLRGRKSSVEEMELTSEPVPVATFVKKHTPLLRLWREDAITAAKKFGIDPSPALEDVAECLASIALETCVEWNGIQRERGESAAGSQMFRRVQRPNREISSGTAPTLEAYALVEGISVREEIRRSFLFKRFKMLVAQHVTLVNDLFSYAKEVANGEVSNILYLHHVEEGRSMEDSLELIEGETNQICEALVELGELLVQLYENDEGLARFVKLGNAMVVGHLLWVSYSQRYYPDLVFDMIVHN